MVNCLKRGALEFNLKEINPQITYQIVVDKLRARYNTPHRKLSLQSEVDSINFEDFIAHHQVRDEKECIRRMDEYLKNITTQLEDGFHIESNKI